MHGTGRKDGLEVTWFGVTKNQYMAYIILTRRGVTSGTRIIDVNDIEPFSRICPNCSRQCSMLKQSISLRPWHQARTNHCLCFRRLASQAQVSRLSQDEVDKARSYCSNSLQSVPSSRPTFLSLIDQEI